MTVNLADRAYRHLRTRLSRGELAPGMRLVNRTLAADIGVSVIPVREAINRLASEGLVEQIPGAGAFVRKITREDLDDLYVLRDALESCAAGEAARNATSDQLDRFDEILKRVADTTDAIQKSKRGHSNKRQLHQWMDDEEAFHHLLIETSQNRLLAKVVDENRAITAVFECQRDSPKLLTAELAKRTLSSKRKLIEAIRKRDADQARQLMSQHIRRGQQTVVEFFFSDDAPGER
ncbi:GntR family transcriptional regulator [Rhodopirellula sp. JC740]|uniref:GntR family transcriptional regulator n=1 Tax=Rhodopirellula halodulae TaxID=2894198 RepID=A0ABS8NNU2_9BACT|nr:GntR family transcriptional regulator [Rhodopirellula sp. JC740]MCC9645165.1 GntR family transcriptional regulator [Rhodopirellula sp. JC740]